MICAFRSTPAPRRNLGLKSIVLAAVPFGIAFAIYASTGVFGDNLHTVAAGKLYRSAQLPTPALDRLIRAYGIENVISLRKEDPPAPALAAEVRHLDELKIAHSNVPLSPQKLPTPGKLAALLERFDAGPYPMLVHCEEGADRTGFAVAIWLVVHEGTSVAEARERELSWRTGHFSFGQAHAMDDFFDLYERTGNGVDLRTWIRDTYPRMFEAQSVKRPDVAYAHDRR